jgi:histone H1/5
MAGTSLYRLNQAISSGVDDGIFVQPKGPSGRVKLAPKASSATKEVSCWLSPRARSWAYWSTRA